MAKLVQNNRKAMVTQLNTLYNCGEQKSISECTASVKPWGGCATTPDWVPPLSADNRKLRLQWAQAHQNCTVENWNNLAWSDETRFLLRFLHTDGRVRIWQPTAWRNAPNLPCVKPSLQADGSGVMEWEMFFSHTLNPVNTNQSSLECHSLFQYCCWPCASLYGHNVPIF